MTDHNNKIYIFVDAKPDETLDLSNDRTHFFVALSASIKPGTFRPLAQFKDTRRQRKIKTAQKIAKAITGGNITMMANAVYGRSSGVFSGWSIDIFKAANDELKTKWKLENGYPVSFEWQDQTFKPKSAMGLFLYAGLIPFLCGPFTLYRDDSSHIELQIMLDPLPGEQVDGMKLMHALIKIGLAKEMWEDLRKGSLGVGMGNLREFPDENGVWTKGKSHPISILTDWAAVAAMALEAPNELKKDCDYSDQEIDAFADIWRAVRKQGVARIVNVDKLKANFAG